MDFEQEGNLGKTDLLLHHIKIERQRSLSDFVLMSLEEVREIEEQLGKFNNLMANLYLYANSLHSDQYEGLIGILKELEPYYRNYKSPQ